MSSYRDDIQETAVISDSVWGGLTVLTEELVRITSATFLSLLFFVTDAAVASDSVIDQVVQLVVEQAAISDSVLDRKTSTNLTTETAKISDNVSSKINVLVNDTATISDSVFDKQRSVTTEVAQITELYVLQRTAHQLVIDTAKGSDSAFSLVSDLSTDTLTLSELLSDQLKAKQLVIDSAVVDDAIIDASDRVDFVADVALISDELFGLQHAHELVTETALLEDEVFGLDGVFGQAWTANTKNWGMSHYQPYTFSSLCVINGRLFGIKDDGVYALDGGQNNISGYIKTAKTDLGRGVLVHPLAAYVEYELSGLNKSMQMDVTTTQDGGTSTYTYSLAQEVADNLTNGRFIFGRGLRGRHFAFTLRMNATSGYINDLNIELAATHRRT